MSGAEDRKIPIIEITFHRRKSKLSVEKQGRLYLKAMRLAVRIALRQVRQEADVSQAILQACALVDSTAYRLGWISCMPLIGAFRELEPLFPERSARDGFEPPT